MKPLSIVVLGGTGFVGRRLVPRLHADGHRIRVLSRNRERRRELGVLPRVCVENCDVHDRAALKRHLAGADAAINLVGILNERGSDGSGFRKAHVELTATLIAACKATGVHRLLQMSALRAGEGASHYLHTRGEAEARVRASHLAWTIFRPSVIFGPGDGLFCRFAELLRKAPVLPIARAGARFAPVYVGDVAEAFARALVHPHTTGHTYELIGPRVVTLREIVRWTGHLSGHRRPVIGLPDALGAMQARIGEWLPGKPISRDNFRSLRLDSIGDKDGLGQLGIVATPMELIVPAMLGADRREAELARYRATHRG
ncbi:MAG TPA: complex I NDUFA9 subunit family protein [Dokdonella sp.]|uniref:complex I NDUFA9 subunit family protein n=1 Tax=Dokdonella sp. TaxID=2291710 RepID=UPI0025B85607|nr:complex I NDUFA9 subunit family protein [Dokdonella sp.]MBX3691014.1 complex I NDUFA9 subunit family protein [Dokdonella sp.]MCW5569016.1 complex I NDUFA9 subunit family protein [Dokdonella sp.]HNR91749.1 complex I NDUFA9 subunit family protein [Dokdonella sp.]